MPSKRTNTRILLQSRPLTSIEPSTFKVDHASPIPSLESLPEGQILVRVTYVSLDPAMRGWLREAKSYIPPVKIGAVMRAAGLGIVVGSKNKEFKAGDEVSGTFGWQEYWSGKPTSDIEILRPPSGSTTLDYLGPLGSSGLTAYFGIFSVGRLKDGDTVVISGAAGSVGLIVTQIALAHPKCKVYAIAGSETKCQMLKGLGCHGVFDYKKEGWKKELRKVGEVDVYFDNVGGDMLDFMLTRLKPHGRVALCGAISDYNTVKPHGLQNYTALISQKATLQGFIVFDYIARYPEGRAYLADMIKKGKLKYKWWVVDGLEGAPDGLKGLFEGVNEGKMVVKVWDGKPERDSKL